MQLVCMLADLKTVARAIDATIDTQRPVAVRYVDASGKISSRLVSKATGKRRSDGTSSRRSTAPRMKESALLHVRDHTSRGQIRHLFLFGIIGWNQNGDTNNWHPIRRGT